ncbi:MAG: T9SS type A sorting domain-containing protein, partial [Candidatus Shapirobacteria bacterium]
YIGLTDYYLEYFENPQAGVGIDIVDNLPFSGYPYIQTVYNDRGRLFACPSNNGLYFRDDFLVHVEDHPDTDMINNNGFYIYPNPSSDQITIDGPEKNNIIRIQVFNINGVLLQHLETDKNILDVSELKRGLYLLEISTKHGVIRKKFIVI